jgi:hypothetical protein
LISYNAEIHNPAILSISPFAVGTIERATLRKTDFQYTVFGRMFDITVNITPYCGATLVVIYLSFWNYISEFTSGFKEFLGVLSEFLLV